MNEENSKNNELIRLFFDKIDQLILTLDDEKWMFPKTKLIQFLSEQNVQGYWAKEFEMLTFKIEMFLFFTFRIFQSETKPLELKLAFSEFSRFIKTWMFPNKLEIFRMPYRAYRTLIDLYLQLHFADTNYMINFGCVLVPHNNKDREINIKVYYAIEIECTEHSRF